MTLADCSKDHESEPRRGFDTGALLGVARGPNIGVGETDMEGESLAARLTLQRDGVLLHTCNSLVGDHSLPVPQNRSHTDFLPDDRNLEEVRVEKRGKISRIVVELPWLLRRCPSQRG